MADIEYTSWEDIQSSFAKAPHLRNALHALLKGSGNGGKKHTAIKLPILEYSYGELLLDQGKFVLPQSVRNNAAGSGLLEALGLSPSAAQPATPSIPIGFVLRAAAGNKAGILEASFRSARADINNTLSGHCYPKQEILPQAILCPGSIFGLFEYFDFNIQHTNPFPYDVSAGFRSAFAVTNFAITHLISRLKTAFSCSLDDETFKAFTTGTVPLSDLLRALLPRESAAYRTRVVFIPFALLSDAKVPEAREFLRLALQEAWIQASHLRNGFVEMLSTKACVIDWQCKKGIAPKDYFEPMARFVDNLNWVVKGKIPGYRVYRNDENAICGVSDCCGGPFGAFLDGVVEVFGNRDPSLKALLLFPEYYNHRGAESLFVPSRLDRPSRSYPDRSFEEHVSNAFEAAKRAACVADNVQLYFSNVGTGGIIAPDFFGIANTVTFKSKTGKHISKDCSLHRRHWFFYDGFAKLQ